MRSCRCCWRTPGRRQPDPSSPAPHVPPCSKTQFRIVLTAVTGATTEAAAKALAAKFATGVTSGAYKTAVGTTTYLPSTTNAGNCLSRTADGVLVTGTCPSTLAYAC